MKILRKPDPSTTITGKRKPFGEAVKALAAKDPETTVRIYEKSGLKAKYLGEIPVSEAVEIASNMEQALMESYGGGEYQLALTTSDGQVLSRYPFNISGAPKGRRQAYTDDEAAKEKKKGSSSDRELLTIVVGKLADAATAGKAEIVELVKAFSGDGSDKGFEREMLSTLYNNALAASERRFDDAVKMLEFSRALTPHIEREDPVNTLIASLTPLIGQVALSRITGAPAQLNAEQLNQLAGQIQQLQAAQQPAALPQRGVMPQTGAVELPQPGTSSKPAQEPAAIDPHHALVDSMVEQFRKDIREGASPESLARTLLAIIAYARTLSRPHRLMAGLANADGDQLEHEFDRFCAAVPELARDQEKVMRLKYALVQILSEYHQAHIEAEDEDTLEEEEDEGQPEEQPSVQKVKAG